MKIIVPEIYIDNCREALDFYQATFGGEIKNLQMSEDLAMFQDIKNKVIHSELHISKQCIFYFLDRLGNQHNGVGNITLVVHLNSRQEIESVFQSLKQDGTVNMTLQKTLQDEYHAIVIDKYGTRWALNYAPVKHKVQPVPVL